MVADRQRLESGVGTQLVTAAFGVGGLVLLLALLVWLFPVPNVTADTNEYVRCARELRLGAYRPLGYSVFLRLLHEASADCRVVFVVQFLLHAGSSIAFAAVLRRAFGAGRALSGVLLGVLLVVNPVALYMSTFLISDSLFAGLSVLWLASGVEFARRPRAWLVAAHLGVLAVLMQVRFIGMFYPLVSAALFVAVLRARGLLPAVVSVLLVVGGHAWTVRETQRRFGVRSFSALGDWTMANNAAAVIPHGDVPAILFEGSDLEEFHRAVMARDHALYLTRRILRAEFIWSREYPGKELVAALQQGEGVGYEEAWVRAGAMAGRYGRALALRYPFAYIRYFVLPNLRQLIWMDRALVRPGAIGSSPLAAEWYVAEAGRRQRPGVVSAPVAQGVARIYNLVLLAGALAAAVIGAAGSRIGGWRAEALFAKLFLALFALAYAGLSVISAPLEMRYVLPLHAAVLGLLYAVWACPTAGDAPRPRGQD
jgi:hypothetical protein